MIVLYETMAFLFLVQLAASGGSAMALTPHVQVIEQGGCRWGRQNNRVEASSEVGEGSLPLKLSNWPKTGVNTFVS
jgi:hypothetical protein